MQSIPAFFKIIDLSANVKSYVSDLTRWYRSVSFACIHTYIHTYGACMHTYIHTYIHAYIHIYIYIYRGLPPAASEGDEAGFAAGADQSQHAYAFTCARHCVCAGINDNPRWECCPFGKTLTLSGTPAKHPTICKGTLILLLYSHHHPRCACVFGGHIGDCPLVPGWRRREGRGGRVSPSPRPEEQAVPRNASVRAGGRERADAGTMARAICHAWLHSLGLTIGPGDCQW